MLLLKMMKMCFVKTHLGEEGKRKHNIGENNFPVFDNMFLVF